MNIHVFTFIILMRMIDVKMNMANTSNSRFVSLDISVRRTDGLVERLVLRVAASQLIRFGALIRVLTYLLHPYLLQICQRRG